MPACLFSGLAHFFSFACCASGRSSEKLDSDEERKKKNTKLTKIAIFKGPWGGEPSVVVSAKLAILKPTSPRAEAVSQTTKDTHSFSHSLAAVVC